MKDFYFHIGLPKSGSGLLQKFYFPYLNAIYLGKHFSAPEFSHEALKRLKKILPIAPNEEAKTGKIPEWIAYVNSVQSKNSEANLPRIISLEGMSAENGQFQYQRWPIGEHQNDDKKLDGEFKLPGFLSEFSAHYSPLGQTKVLLVLRNQSEWLASKYAERSSRIFGASQHDFEKQVNTVLEKNIQYLNWHEWAVSLKQKLGSDNLKVLLLEEIDKPEFLEQLNSFFMANLDISETLSNVKFNKKKRHSNTWELQDWKDQNHEMAAINDLLRKSSFVDNNSLIAESIRKVIKRNKNSEYIKNGLKRLERKRDNHITLNPSTTKKIQEFCRNSNEKLADLLNKDLFRYGY